MGEAVRQRVDQERLRRFLTALGARLRLPVRLYLVGGTIMVDLGLRRSTVDIDYVAVTDDRRADDDLERAIRSLKDDLDVNVEPASPQDFLPVPAWAREAGRFIGQYGPLAVYHYHLPSVVIAKIARGYEQDLDDAETLLRGGHVSWQDIERTWGEMRSSPRGWVRYEPAEVERRLEGLRQRTGS